MKEIKYFLVLQNADLTEGRGPMRPVARFTHHPDVVLCARGRDAMNCGDGDIKQETIIIYDDYSEFEQATSEQLKRSALAKLSSEEKKALGL